VANAPELFRTFLDGHALSFLTDSIVFYHTRRKIFGRSRRIPLVRGQSAIWTRNNPFCIKCLAPNPCIVGVRERIAQSQQGQGS
jgi:hypothetical protein